MEIEATKTRTCALGVCDPERTQGLKAPAPKGDYVLVNLKGPGLFLAAEVVKQGGSSDLTFVILDIDGRNVTNLSYIAARNSGLTAQNPYGIVYFQGNRLDTLTIGFPSPLRFERELKLSVKVSEDGVLQMLANVIHGK
jgi:hypothetical protein